MGALTPSLKTALPSRPLNCRLVIGVVASKISEMSYGYSSIVLMNGIWILLLILILSNILLATPLVFLQFLFLYMAKMRICQIFKFCFPFGYEFHL